MLHDLPAPETEPADILTETALVPVRERHDGWTPLRQRTFLETLADSGCVTTAAQAAGMTTASAYRLRARADARGFRMAWSAALERAMQRLLPLALDRALNGTVRQRFYHGDLIAEERIHSDRLILWMLEKGAAMLEGGDLRREIARNWDSAMDALEAGDTEPPAFLDREDFRIWVCEDSGAFRTNCPPPPRFRGYESYHRDTSDYERALTREEEDVFLRRLERATGSDEELRRRFFGLPPEGAGNG